jgi:asparagine synthase (glutamine-hydrolysing)
MKLMSGIAAVLHLDGSTVPPWEIESLARALKPYGPDRQRTLICRDAAFVFCLHALTPEDDFERQPLLFANRFVVLFDGRIDNRAELSEALGIRPRDQYSMPDSMLALRLFDRWDEDAFEQIVGDFAIVVMDLQQGRLICARDQMGLRVLHYHRSDKRFAVATAPEALFALNWVPRILNADKVGDTLVGRGLNGETTFYRDVNRVLPGCIVRLHEGRFSKRRYWDPENIADVRFKSDQQYVEAFQAVFDGAVKARLRSRNTPCATITGGLDSSSIAVVAADMLAANGKKLTTFTAVPEAGFFRQDARGNYFDETPYVRQIAENNPNLVPNFVPPSGEPILDQIAEQIRLGGAPSGGILNGLWIMDICAAARRAGHNVMLVGEMGNLTISYGGRGLFAELLRRGRWVRLFREIMASGYQWEKMTRQWLIAPFVPAPIFSRYKRWRRRGQPPWHGWPINPEFAVASGVVDRAALEHAPFDAAALRDCRLGRIYDFNCYSETADWFAKLRAGFGIDSRTPAFDRRVVEFCIGIPTDQYLRNGCDRWLIRRAMKGRLPDVVLNKRKYGVQAADWHPRLTRELNYIKEKVKRLASNRDVASIVDLELLAAILDTWPEHQPPDYSAERERLMVVPQALGVTYFIENVQQAATDENPCSLATTQSHFS